MNVLYYWITEEYVPDIAEVCSRVIFADKATGEKWIREQLELERRRVVEDNPGLPMEVVVSEITDGGTCFSLGSDGEEYLSYYFTPARFYP